MEAFIAAHETAFRFGVFASLLALFAALESVSPKRGRALPRGHRWFTNMGMVVLSTVLLRAAFPLVAVGAALWAGERGIGLLNIVDWPGWVELVVALAFLDFVIWGQHWTFHHVPLLWRMHRVHHADRDFDVTTALRFHPFEIAVSMGVKMGAVLVLGPSAAAVILFEVILNGMALFNHANLALPGPLDRVLRLFLVTPDMHRVHHSVIDDEHNRNFGFNLSLWDRLFGTYRAQPRAGHEGMHIGLDAWQDERPAKLVWSLLLPFSGLEGGQRASGGQGA
ncbi:MAG: sterol desaturase family protein [Alphaproteobacteria bacterium]